MRASSFAFLAVIASTAACTDRPDPVPTSPAPPPPAASLVAYLSVSSDNPAIGDTIVVQGNLSYSDSAGTFGSFTARLGYDGTLLKYLGDVSLPGGMRAINPTDGEVRVAGASGNGFTDRRLFAARFQVLDLGSIASLHLFVDELNAADYASQLPALKRDAAPHLDLRLR